MHSQTPSIETIKSSMRATWMAGDFGVIAKTISGAGETFVNRLHVPVGAHDPAVQTLVKNEYLMVRGRVDGVEAALGSHEAVTVRQRIVHPEVRRCAE